MQKYILENIIGICKIFGITQNYLSIFMFWFCCRSQVIKQYGLYLLQKWTNLIIPKYISSHIFSKIYSQQSKFSKIYFPINIFRIIYRTIEKNFALISWISAKTDNQKFLVYFGNTQKIFLEFLSYSHSGFFG